MRTIESYQIQVDMLHDGKPIISPEAKHPWENRSITDVACAFITNPDELKIIVAKLPFTQDTREVLLRQPALCILVYSATGDGNNRNESASSSLGLAVLGPELTLLARHSEPVLSPDQAYDNRRIESGRLTKIGRRYVLTYNAAGSETEQSSLRIAIASTTDFITWVKHGTLRGNFNQGNSVNGVMFERKIGTKYLMLHQLHAGREAGTIHWAETTDVYREWRTRGLLMKPIAQANGGQISLISGPPPVKLPDGRFLVFYLIISSKSGESKKTTAGIAIGDPGSRYFIVKRHEPLILPATPGPGQTPVQDRTFSVCGAYLFNQNLYFPFSDGSNAMFGAVIRQDQMAHFIQR